MKTKSFATVIVLALLATLNLQLSSAQAQGTAFTYQGRLNDGGNPANGVYDLRFAMFDALTSGAQQGSLTTNTATAVSNGLFTVTLDFGNQFPGANRWLEIAVRTNGGASFLTLSPRQALTPAPYAITAGNLSGVVPGAGVAGTYPNPVTFNNAANSFSGNGSGLANVNALTLGGIGSAGFWQTSGNAGTTAGLNFLGTADNQPLIVKVNGQEAIRFEPTTDTPNVVGGYSGNYVQPGLPGVTIGGGGTFLYGDQPNVVTNNGNYATIAGGYHNTVTNYGGAILGGSVNFAGGYFAVIGGGQFHTILSDYAFVGGGFENQILPFASGSFIGSGYGNVIKGDANGENDFVYVTSVIGGGYANNILTNSGWSFVGGGYGNVIRPYAREATIGGGLDNAIEGTSNLWASDTACGCTIAGGAGNTIQSNSPNSTISGGEANVIQTNAGGSTIGGGFGNITSGVEATVSGGSVNTASGQLATVSGGTLNIASGEWCAVSGGYGNTATGYASTVPGGYDNHATGDDAFAAGNHARASHAGSFVWADSGINPYSSTFADGFFVRCTGGARFVSAVDGTGAATAGVRLLAGDTSWSSISDKNAKKNFQPVNGAVVLEKLAAIPVQQWNYKWESDTNTPHIGPMAQDFKGAFYPGRDDKSITTLEFDGVELAAIQGLNEKLEAQAKEKDARISALEKELSELKHAVEKLSNGKN